MSELVWGLGVTVGLIGGAVGDIINVPGDFPTIHEAVAAAMDGDGDVGINDFLDLIAQWGTDPGGPPDFDGDGNVEIDDFLELIAN